MAKSTSKNPIILRVEVDGSSGKKYIVVQRANGNWSCGCPHWKFRRPVGGCKHIKAAQAVNDDIWQVQVVNDEICPKCGSQETTHNSELALYYCCWCGVWFDGSESQLQFAFMG